MGCEVRKTKPKRYNHINAVKDLFRKPKLFQRVALKETIAFPEVGKLFVFLANVKKKLLFSFG